MLLAAAVAAIAAPLAFGMVQAAQEAAAPEHSLIENSTNAAGESQATAELTKSEGWLDRIEAAGFRNLNVEQIIRLKEHDIDADYIRQVRAMGFDLDAETLIRFREHDISSEYINELKQVGLRDLNAEQLIRLQEHEVTPEYVRQAQNRFEGITVDQIIRLKEHDILPIR